MTSDPGKAAAEWKVMFSPLCVCLIVDMCVNRITKKYQPDLYETWWRGLLADSPIFAQ